MRSVLLALLLGCSTPPVTPSDPIAARKSGIEIEPVSGLGLFSDERARSQQLILDALGEEAASALPPEATQRAWALAAEGKNPLTGQACGRPLLTYQARQRWAAELGILGYQRSSVWCAADGGCQLEVTLNLLRDDSDDRRTRLVAPIAPSGPPLDSLASAIAALAPPPPGDGRGATGLLGALGANPPLQEEDLLKLRISPADRRDRTKVEDALSGFPALTLGQVQTCLSASDDTVQVLTELSTDGTLTRCEGEPFEEQSAASCICGQLQRSAAASWLAGKRWSVSVGLDRRDLTTSDRRLVVVGGWNIFLRVEKVEGRKLPRVLPKVEDPSIEAWSPGPGRLAAGCFTNAFAEPGVITSRWAVWFDGAGRPTKILEQKRYPPLAKEQADCVARALRTAQAPCPSRAGLWAMADLRIAARDPNAEPSPFGPPKSQP